MPTPDRRQDRATAANIAEALRIKTAFGPLPAYVFAAHHQHPLSVVRRVLAGRYDPRQAAPHVAR